jgi:hypothetical protein
MGAGDAKLRPFFAPFTADEPLARRFTADEGIDFSGVRGIQFLLA